MTDTTQFPKYGRPRPVPFRGLAGWVLFDVATQPFFTLLTTFVFAPFFATLRVAFFATLRPPFFAAFLAAFLAGAISKILSRRF